MMHMTTFDTPLGEMTAASRDGRICLLEFSDRKGMEGQLRALERLFGGERIRTSDALLNELEERLKRYFRGELREFDLPLDLRGTDFQLTVWQALRGIPYGTTVTYGELAGRIGNPRAVRAVAGANSRNRIALLVPCHRVIGAEGKLTGYAGGLERKRKLLEREGTL